MAYDDGPAHRRDGASRILTPNRILTREAFENAIVVNLSDRRLPPIVRRISTRSRGTWEFRSTSRIGKTVGHDIPLLANVQPAGEVLGEGFHRAGGVPGIFGELIRAGKVHTGDA